MTLGSLSIRARLMLWYAGSLAAIVLALWLGVYVFVRASLLQQMERYAGQDLAIVAKALQDFPPELDETERHSAVGLFQVNEGERVFYASRDWQSRDLTRTYRQSRQHGSLGLWQSTQGDPYFFKTSTVNALGDIYQVVVAHEARQMQDVLNNLWLSLAAIFPASLALALAGGYLMAGRALAPVGHIAAKAHEITAEKLAQRLEVGNPADEFGRLATILNATFARLEDSFERLRRFTADASHELRTPLTVLRSVGEVALQKPQSSAAYREVIGSMLEETDRLARLTEGLLALARADADQTRLNLEPTDLGRLLGEATECLRVLAEEKSQHLTCHTPVAINASVDRSLLRQAIINLVANAITYTPTGGRIDVVLREAGSQALIEVRDSGPGIAHAHQRRIFDRFYRVDQGRSSAAGGMGLGLAITRWIIEQHGGAIEVCSVEGEGAVFRVTLETLMQAPTGREAPRAPRSGPTL